MPSAPPFPYKTAPIVYPPLSPVSLVAAPAMTLSFPHGCTSAGYLVLDVMPTYDREPETLPDVPGAGWSYSRFMEYLDMGVAPVSGFSITPWAGRGAYAWSVFIDGVDSGVVINAFDGTVGPIGVSIPAPGGSWSNASYSFHLEATYHDRPEFQDFWINAATVGIVAFGPGTMSIDTNVPYVLDGVPFGCCQRHAAFFPTILWGKLGYWDPWVAAHYNVTDTLGPVDRWGNYLPLTGPWGSAVPKQYVSSAPFTTLCGVGSCQPGSSPSFPAGPGDVYASTLSDFVETTTYSEISYPVTTVPVTLAGCPGTPAPWPVFDPTRSYVAVT